MAMSLAGLWKSYGHENLDLVADKLRLSKPFKEALKRTHVFEEIHVNGDHAHVNVLVTSFTVPAHTKELKFTFGTEHTHPLPFGHVGKATINQSSEHKWEGMVQVDNHHWAVSREIRNGEMWVTIQGGCGTKTVRKFERTTQGPGGCTLEAPKAGASAFEGHWRLYGSDNFHGFMQALGVPLHLQCVLAEMDVYESITVQGKDVSIKIQVPDVHVPAHTFEMSWKFGEHHCVQLPFGHHAKAIGMKLSDSKWIAKLTDMETLGEVHLTREVVGNDMWVILDVKGKRIVHKFARFWPISGGQC